MWHIYVLQKCKNLHVYVMFLQIFVRNSLQMSNRGSGLWHVVLIRYAAACNFLFSLQTCSSLGLGQRKFMPLERYSLEFKSVPKLMHWEVGVMYSLSTRFTIKAIFNPKWSQVQLYTHVHVVNKLSCDTKFSL